MIIFSLILAALIILFFKYKEVRQRCVYLEKKNKEILSAKEKLSKQKINVEEQNLELNLQLDELEEVNSVKNKLFTIISHDVRGPVKSVLGMLNLLKTKGLTEKELNALVIDLSFNISNVSTFLDNLMLWADGQMNSITANFSEIDIKELIQQNIDLLRFRAGQKNITLINNLIVPIRCKADRDMVNLVIRNLLMNAIKFTPINGKICLVAILENDNIKVQIKDNGIGIPSDVINQIFDLKYQTSSGTIDEKGTGLGLVLCKDFVKINGGEIGVESKEGEGSRFHFTLPLVQEMVKS
ncbi:MAG: HAMP domain-containing histidine kinase [Cyclobacteriaceae bacterium]|nr:HAMP domain-containing histidine kinase [Cyclobacteriaceae bacterium]